MGSAIDEALRGVALFRALSPDDSVADGKIYCEYEAPNPQAIREHSRRVGYSADRISEVARKCPEMFR